MQTALFATRVLAAASLFLFAGFPLGEPIWLQGRVVLVAFYFAGAFAALMALDRLGVLENRSRTGTLGRMAVGSLVLAALAGAVLYAVQGELSDTAGTVLLLEGIILLTIVVVNYSGLAYRLVIAGNVVFFLVALSPSLRPSSISSLREVVLGQTGVRFSDSTDYRPGVRLLERRLDRLLAGRSRQRLLALPSEDQRRTSRTGRAYRNWTAGS